MKQIDFKIPAPPEGYEAALNDGTTPCEYVLTCSDGWVNTGGLTEVRAAIVARRKRTLADWANEQPLFKALAEMRNREKVNGTFPIHDQNDRWWVAGSVFYLGAPPPGLSGKLTLKNGKWKDVQ